MVLANVEAPVAKNVGIVWGFINIVFQTPVLLKRSGSVDGSGSGHYQSPPTAKVA